MSTPRQNCLKNLKKFFAYAILKKPQKWGQILNTAKSRQVIRQKKALDVSFSIDLVLRSFKVTRGQKMPKQGHKDRISIIIKSSEIIDGKEARKVSFSIKLVSKSFKVTQGQKLQKVKKVKFRSLSKVVELNMERKL